MKYGTKVLSEDEVAKVLTEDDPSVEVHVLRKKLLIYTRSLNDVDKDKYEDDMFYIQLREEKA